MTLESYLPIFIQLILALGIAIAILVFSWFLGQRALTNKVKDGAYECGLIMEGASHPRFAVKFYLTAMLFILFDIEVVFLIPWALVFREFVASGIAIVMPGLFFIGLLVFGLVYEIKKGGLEWEK
jgi:NADH-quinone oxidoreductase subunit A